MALDEIRLRRMAAQHLLVPADKKTVVRDLMGLQAQFMPNAMHALKIRCNEPVDTFPCGLVKSWTVRGTVHVFLEEDLPLFIRANGGQDYRRNEWQGRRFWNRRDAWALTPERQQYLSTVILDSLARGERTREELKALCREAGMTEVEEGSMFDPWGGGVRELCERGFMHYAVREEKAFCLTPRYEPMEDAVAELEMARRYFTSYGPATVHDAMYYFHTTAAKVKAWLTALPVSSVVCGGNTYYSIDGQVPITKEMPSCLFLAGFDPLMLGYEKKESLYLPPEYMRGIFNLAGIVMPALLLNGTVAGRWKNKNGKVRVELFRPLTAAERHLVCQGAEALWPDMKKLEFAE